MCACLTYTCRCNACLSLVRKKNLKIDLMYSQRHVVFLGSPSLPPLALLALIQFTVFVQAGYLDCNCNHGLVTQETPQCVCSCFGEYLPPHCLYTPTDTADMQIWLSQSSRPSFDGNNNNASANLSLFAADIISGLSLGLQRNPGDGTLRFVRAKAAVISIPDPTLETSCTVTAVVAMPGWMARQLLADVKHGTTTGYVFRNCFTGAMYTLTAAFDDTTGPALPQRYTDSSMAFFWRVKSSWYVSFSTLVWPLCALIVAVLLPLVESHRIFNTAFNATYVSVRPPGATAAAADARRREYTGNNDNRDGGILPTRGKNKEQQAIKMHGKMSNLVPDGRDPAASLQQYEKHRKREIPQQNNTVGGPSNACGLTNPLNPQYKRDGGDGSDA
ncbi:hypothetical protein, conserved [Trypanosoma cruzi]|uniref:Uncharacterized protein n=2 Tax=Trypanosoma cruzi TaxID=5693 RepID=Q4CU08_TRYCC|nr:hypothetical protein, conserved [Trypanosoma cruzi]EAN83756.1 hypothetical protein, conserved [Trypanosoma cruzi]|eukprot:XP_805607.1 hypothetical protein [Trypanosoma cruzi strain CL Brener]